MPIILPCDPWIGVGVFLFALSAAIYIAVILGHRLGRRERELDRRERTLDRREKNSDRRAAFLAGIVPYRATPPADFFKPRPEPGLYRSDATTIIERVREP